MFRSTRPITAIFITAISIAIDTPVAAQDKAPPTEAVIGHYRFESGLIMSVEKSSDGLTLKQMGQEPQSLKPSQDGKFSFAGGQAHLVFNVDQQGVAQFLNVYFDNKTLPALRIDAVVAKKAADDLDSKFKNQTHDPACEVTLRRVIEEFRAGRPDYSKMTLSIGQLTRQQLPALEKKIKRMGAVKEVRFTGVSPGGSEQFEVTFDGGRSKWRIQCLANGWVGNIQL